MDIAIVEGSPSDVDVAIHSGWVSVGKVWASGSMNVVSLMLLHYLSWCAEDSEGPWTPAPDLGSAFIRFLFIPRAVFRFPTNGLMSFPHVKSLASQQGDFHLISRSSGFCNINFFPNRLYNRTYSNVRSHVTKRGVRHCYQTTVTINTLLRPV